MVKANNKFILKAKRKRRIKRISITVIVIIIVISIFLVKSDVFTVKKIAILGNPIMSGEDVKKRTENLIGQNIFLINKNNIIKEVEKNPYVENVEISRTYPKQIDIKISEKQGVYYVEKDGYKYILDSESKLLEKADTIENRSLVNVIGIELGNVEVGNKTFSNIRVLQFLDVFSQIVQKNPTNYNIDTIDLTDLMNIKVYIGKVEGRLGNDENIPEKMNKLLHIVENPSIGITKGYVDVGFDGSPIYYKEER